MDPDANLKEQLALAKRITEYAGSDDSDPDAVELAELVIALHEWIGKGGFPPKAWAKKGE